MYEYIGDEQIIPRGWPSLRGGCGSSLRFVGRLLQGGSRGSDVVVLHHGVNAGEVDEGAPGVEAEEAAAGVAETLPKNLIGLLPGRISKVAVPEAPAHPNDRARGRRVGIAESSTQQGAVDDG